IATESSGRSVRGMGMPVSWRSRSSSPLSSAPPPVMTMPRSMMSRGAPVGRPAANAGGHVAGGLAGGDAGAVRGRHRRLDDVDLARAGGVAGVLHGALLGAGDGAGNAHDDAGPRPGAG